MKIALSILFSILLVSAKSQSTSDTITCLPNSKLVKAIKEIENCKIIKQELQATKESVIILESRIDLKDSIIHKYEIKDTIASNRFINYEKQITNLNNQIKNEDFISQIQISALKVKGRVKMGVAALVGATLVLLLKK